MQAAVIKHNADVDSVIRTPSASRKGAPPQRPYDKSVPELSYSDDPYDSSSSNNSSFESLDRPITPPPALFRYVSSSKKCDQPIPVTPIRNYGPTKAKHQKPTPYTPSRGQDSTKPHVTPGKKLKRASFQVWVEGSEAGEFIPMTHRFMKRSMGLTEDQLFEREYRLLMQEKDRRDSGPVKELNADDEMELPPTPKAINGGPVASGSGRGSDAMDISPCKPPLSRQATEIIDHETFRGGSVALPVFPAEWIEKPSNALRSHPTEIYFGESR